MPGEHPFISVGRCRRLNQVLALLLCASLSASFAAPVHARFSSPSSLEGLSIKGFVWSDMQTIRANGVPLSIRLFRSPHTVTEAARLLAERNDLFQRMLVTPGLARLSGLAENTHWLAEIQSTPGGVIGRVSTMSTRDESPARTSAHGRAESLLSWLPVGARRLLHHRDMGGPDRFIYAIAMGADALAAGLASRLTAQGWVCQQGCGSSPRRQAWQRDNTGLLLFIQAAANGSLLYLHIE